MFLPLLLLFFYNFMTLLLAYAGGMLVAWSLLEISFGKGEKVKDLILLAVGLLLLLLSSPHGIRIPFQ